MSKIIAIVSTFSYDYTKSCMYVEYETGRVVKFDETKKTHIEYFNAHCDEKMYDIHTKHEIYNKSYRHTNEMTYFEHSSNIFGHLYSKNYTNLVYTDDIERFVGIHFLRNNVTDKFFEVYETSNTTEETETAETTETTENVNVMYKKTEKVSRAVNNQGDPIKFELYISTAKGKRRKWAGERETLNDIDILIRQNYLEKGFEYISVNIIVRFSTGHELIERRYKKINQIRAEPPQQEAVQEYMVRMKDWSGSIIYGDILAAENGDCALIMFKRKCKRLGVNIPKYASFTVSKYKD